MEPDPLMTIDDASEYLNIPRATLYSWRTRHPGRGPRALKVGGVLRYRRCVLEQWVSDNTEP